MVQLLSPPNGPKYPAMQLQLNGLELPLDDVEVNESPLHDNGDDEPAGQYDPDGHSSIDAPFSSPLQ